MKINRKWLEKFNACTDGKEWYLTNCPENPSEGIKGLMKGDKYDWANWLIVRIMNYKQYVSYAIFAAEQVIDIYEKQYPDDKRPREAMEAAKKCIDIPSKKNKQAAYASANAAANAAHAAAYASANAAYAAYASANAADAAAYAAYAAANADSAAAYVANKKEMRIKILEYGISLLNKEK